MIAPAFDRRLHVRHFSTSLVRATNLPGRPKHRGETGHLVNLSVGGCAVKFDAPLELKPKTRVHLVIVVNVNGVVKVYHRFATVAHVTRGIVGFATDVWSAEAERDVISWLKK